MDINDIRRANLRRIASNYKSRAEFARVLERSEQQLYYLIGRSASKPIGDRIARDIENQLDLPRGKLDLLEESTKTPATASDGVNLEVLQDCIVAVEGEIDAQKLEGIPATRKAQAIALAYSATMASGKAQVVSVDFIVRTLAH
ncbi:hypothetical protein [uncultured Microbulbifer sp.]|uniref:hypothetical protein n=1 Tax=uncultured Microbulbifer sp. TaxID=348147 RepID=UPI00261EE561|nr:hypothetical protein [uncultured Microbulbifer sp.]